MSPSVAPQKGLVSSNFYLKKEEINFDHQSGTAEKAIHANICEISTEQENLPLNYI